MSDIGDLTSVPNPLPERVRLFPLPNLVMFPHVMQPLHIFEPRYRQMVEDAVAGDRLISMAVLAPGWEKDYDGRPPLRPIACLARIANCQSVGDGRFNILALGLRRIALVRELPPKHLFREAQVQEIRDEYPASAAAQRPHLQHELVEVFRQALPAMAGARDQVQELLAGDIPLGMLTDIIAYTLELDLQVKLQLLAEAVVDRRAEALLAKLKSAAARDSRASFPPDFSAN